ncbi:MAG: hypothetical protein WBX25_15735, partial [Rhodomicrobium sp.]
LVTVGKVLRRKPKLSSQKADHKNEGLFAEMGVDTAASTLVSPEAASRMHAARDRFRRTRAIATTGTMLVDNASSYGTSNSQGSSIAH